MTPQDPLSSNSELAASELLRPEQFGEYLLQSESEIRFALRSLRDAQVLITMYIDDGPESLPSSLLAIDEMQITLDTSANEAMNLRACSAKQVTCVTALQKIRIQFSLHGLRRASHGGRPAFAADLPSTLLRLQRRDYYRLATPSARPIKCLIPVRQESGEHGSVAVNLIDISGSGLGLIAPPGSLDLQVGTEIPGCRFELPQVGTIVITLQVRNVFNVTLRNGMVVKRAGCQFVNLPGPMLTWIQRYIIRIERERKALETSGLD